MREYLALHPQVAGALFIHHNLTYVTQFQFEAILKHVISTASVYPVHFSLHSFPLGAAMAAITVAMNEETIQTWDSWKSREYQ